MPIAPFNVQGIVAHSAELDRFHLVCGHRGQNLKRVLLPLGALLATGGTGTRLAQISIRIAAFVPVIPQNAHGALIVALNFYRI
jgi:hypothetical protein